MQRPCAQQFGIKNDQKHHEKTTMYRKTLQNDTKTRSARILETLIPFKKYVGTFS